MKPLYRRTLGFQLLLFVLAFTLIPTVTYVKESSTGLLGSILININNYDEFIEFKFQNGNLVKTEEGKTVEFQKEGRTYLINMSDKFKSIFDLERVYDSETEKRLEAIMSQYDLEKLYNLRHAFVRSRGNFGSERHFLTGPGKKSKHFWGQYSDFFIPNRQFSHIIYYPHFAVEGEGLLIDLNSKEISFPFGLDNLERVVWNKEGQYIAYSVRNSYRLFQRTLVVRDIKGRVVLKKNIRKNVCDITWAPEANYVALLTAETRIGLSPSEILFALSGHPYTYRTYYLEIYDMAGNTLYTGKVKSNFKNSSGHIVWPP